MELRSLKYLDINYAGTKEIFSDQAVVRLKCFQPTLTTIEGGKRKRVEQVSGKEFRMRIRNGFESFKPMRQNESNVGE